MDDISIGLHARILTYDPPDKNKKSVIPLSTVMLADRDFTRILPIESLDVYVMRVAFEHQTIPKNLRKMASLIIEAAGLILPEERLDALCYSCTATLAVIGYDAIIEVRG